MPRIYIISESQLENIVSDVDKTGTDVEFIERLKLGDERARTKLFDKYYPMFRRKILDKTHKLNEDEINEIISDALNRAMNKINLYTYKGSFNGWLYKLLSNSITDFVLRYKKNKGRMTTIPSDMDITDNDSEESETGQHYMKLLTLFKPNIPPKQVKFIELYLSGMKHSEIAELMGTSEGTSKWHVSTGLAKFKRWLLDNNMI